MCQAPDQDANFLADSRSPATLSGPPPPIEAETGAMPADDAVWVHNDERFGPAGSELLQQDPEQIDPAHSSGVEAVCALALQAVGEGQALEGGVGAAAEEHPNHGQESEE